MRSVTFLALGMAIWLFGAGIGFAQDRLPDALEQLAPFICNGVVLSLENKGEDPSASHEIPPAKRDSIMCATIKVLHVFKGDLPKEIKFTYKKHPDNYQNLDGDDYPALKKGHRYRLFLALNSKKDAYIGELEAEHDMFNFHDVEELNVNERDDNPFLHQKDAVLIAQELLKANNLASQIDPATTMIIANCGSIEGQGDEWIINFCKTGLPTSTYCVGVRMDRTIDPKMTKLK